MLTRDSLVIAVDEVSHAELSWDVSDALAERMTGAEREDVDRARVRAISELRLVIMHREEATANAIGSPSIAACLAILGSLEARIGQSLAA